MNQTKKVEFWTGIFPVPGSLEQFARAAEESGFDGIGFADTQNKVFERYISQVQRFLRGEEVTLDKGYRSRMG
ncbi:MAG: hypothetical protein HY268_05920 [Deltaproteobacteria bacterium]|nr:hypothetical protein [Deltaproteobacteria bacterium]